MKVVKAKVEIDKYVFEKPIPRYLETGYKHYWDCGGIYTIKKC